MLGQSGDVDIVSSPGRNTGTSLACYPSTSTALLNIGVNVHRSFRTTRSGCFSIR